MGEGPPFGSVKDYVDEFTPDLELVVVPVLVDTPTEDSVCEFLESLRIARSWMLDQGLDSHFRLGILPFGLHDSREEDLRSGEHEQEWQLSESLGVLWLEPRSEVVIMVEAAGPRLDDLTVDSLVSVDLEEQSEAQELRRLQS